MLFVENEEDSWEDRLVAGDKECVLDNLLLEFNEDEAPKPAELSGHPPVSPKGSDSKTIGKTFLFSIKKLWLP